MTCSYYSGRLEKGADPHNRKFVLVREANYHPDGGFYPVTKKPFVLLLALPGDDIKLEDFVAFYCDGTCGVQIKVLLILLTILIGGSRGRRRCPIPPTESNSFVFACVFGEKCPHRRLAPPNGSASPPKGNSGSATDSVCFRFQKLLERGPFCGTTDTLCFGLRMTTSLTIRFKAKLDSSSAVFFYL